MLEYKFIKIFLSKRLFLINNIKSTLYNATLFYQLIKKFIFFTTIRSDIAYTISRVNNFMSRPKKTHLNVAKYILSYIKDTMDYKIYYHKKYLYFYKIHGCILKIKI